MRPRALPTVGELWVCGRPGAALRWSLVLLPRLEHSGLISANCNLYLLASSDSSASASRLCQRVMMPSRTNLATGIPSSKVKYSRLSSTDDGYIDLQFKKTPPKIPYKAIALATVLFLIGAFLIIIGSLLLSGYISKGGADRAVPVLIIGILVFLPGFYHLRIAYYASKGYRGYSYDDIPDFDD
ncbi:transmembrane protein 230 isoform X2 [Rhinopithecus roxellana]|uniref:transmembrane protein 230 isoform X2 n=1 Tax=Rhinopithecus roxellana TaxID=61622 RepID=UPI0005334553|nr:transmembrane protein 230 isoform X2 [Rhinopithecus roxellana]